MPTDVAISPQRALLVTRIIWAGQITGVLILGVIIMSVRTAHDAVLPSAAAAVPWVILLCGVPGGLFARGEIFKRGWVGEVITPQAYIAGNIVAFAICEGAAFVALVFCLVDGRVGLHLSAAAAAVAMLVLLWPNGKAMVPLGSPGPTLMNVSQGD
jgi:hypothetical protein